MDFTDRKLLDPSKIQDTRPAETAAEFFARGVAMEEDPTTWTDAIEAYRHSTDLDPGHAAAFFNLGTLYSNRQDFTQAERFYRQSVSVDPRYHLTFFHFDIVFDETGRS